MDKTTKAALTIYGDMSFGVSLDDLANFGNLVQTKQTFVYQSVLYGTQSFIEVVKEPTKAWLEQYLPNYEGIIATYHILVDALADVSKSEREAKLNTFLDTYNAAHYENKESLHEVMSAGKKVYIEATLLKQWGFGEYASEPNNGFTIQIGDNPNNHVDVTLDDTTVLR